MLISARHLIDRLRYPRSRADELAMVRARFAAQPSRRDATEEQLALAERLRLLRIEAHAAVQEVDACRSCSKGHPLPAGRWDGGHCCGGNTSDLFNRDEVAALKLSGTVASELSPPRSDHAGCAFRGPTGCSLPPADRPNICLRYVCLELRDELKSSGQWARVAELSRQLRDTFEEFDATWREPSFAQQPLAPALAVATADTSGSRR